LKYRFLKRAPNLFNAEMIAQ